MSEVSQAAVVTRQRGMQTTSDEQSVVTVIGLGLMGQALARAFLESGYTTTVWNRSAGKAEQLVAEGAIRAGSASDAIAASPLVIVCVSDYAAVHDLLSSLEDGLAGRVLVNLSTGSSQEARETAEWAAKRNASYLDGAILADPQGIGGAETQLLYSGPQSAFDAHAPTLRSLGGDTTYLGADHGLSSLYDAAVLASMWSILNGFLHGAALLNAADVSAATFAPTAIKGITTVAGWVADYADQIDAGTYPAPDATIDTHLAAMEHLIHESELHGISTELPRFVKAMAERAVAHGEGTDGYAALIDQFRAASDVR